MTSIFKMKYVASWLHWHYHLHHSAFLPSVTLSRWLFVSWPLSIFHQHQHRIISVQVKFPDSQQLGVMLQKQLMEKQQWQHVTVSTKPPISTQYRNLDCSVKFTCSDNADSIDAPCGLRSVVE